MIWLSIDLWCSVLAQAGARDDGGACDVEAGAWLGLEVSYSKVSRCTWPAECDGDWIFTPVVGL